MITLSDGKYHGLVLDWKNWAFGAAIEFNRFILGATIQIGPVYFELNLFGV